jgi:hypothetical protein
MMDETETTKEEGRTQKAVILGLPPNTWQVTDLSPLRVSRMGFYV